MSDGKTHKRALRKGWLIAIPFGLLIAYITKDIVYLPLFYSNFILCEFIDPDADQVGLTLSEGDMLRASSQVFLGFFGSIFVAYWLPYAYLMGVGSRWDKRRAKSGFSKLLKKMVSPIIILFRGHRSIATHSLVIGTLGRMIWFNLLVWFIMDYYYVTPSRHVMDAYYLTQFLAWSIGDGIHLYKDGMILKKLKFKKRKKRNNLWSQ